MLGFRVSDQYRDWSLDLAADFAAPLRVTKPSRADAESDIQSRAYRRPRMRQATSKSATLRDENLE